jgi:hypothetical protein
MKKRLLYGIALLAALPLPAAASCGAAFCTINTNWNVQGVWGEPGTRLDLRYEYVNLNQPRSGSRKVSVGEVPRHHDEVYTVNRNWIAGLDLTFNADWGATVTLPWVDRSHFHLHNHGGGQLPESWKFSEVGDARVVAHRRLASFENAESHRLGIAGADFGLKLPTGRIDVRNGDAELAERSLQPGTGTVDAIIGLHTAHSLPMHDLSWFAQSMLQVPLGSRSGYRPGGRLSVDAGVRYELAEKLGALLQLNALFRGRDRGAQAEPEDSGGTAYYIGPGLSYQIGESMQVYGFVQVPIHQRVNGVQLTAKQAVVLGISGRF